MKVTTSMMTSVKTTVEMYARRWSRSTKGHLGYEDLVQVGYMAAMKAADTFDASNGASFATYCRKPVSSAMRGAVAEWRGTMLSLDAPMGDEDGGSTFLDSLEAECASPEESLAAQERAVLVRGLVDKAVEEFEAHKDMARMLVERLVEGAQGEERFRAEGGLSLREMGEKFGVSRQTVLNVEKRLRARLAEVLAEVA